eukprot:873467-Rhodomonas_salina.1
MERAVARANGCWICSRDRHALFSTRSLVLGLAASLQLSTSAREERKGFAAQSFAISRDPSRRLLPHVTAETTSFQPRRCGGRVYCWASLQLSLPRCSELCHVSRRRIAAPPPATNTHALVRQYLTSHQHLNRQPSTVNRQP